MLENPSRVAFQLALFLVLGGVNTTARSARASNASPCLPVSIDALKLGPPSTAVKCYTLQMPSPSLGRDVSVNVIVPKGYSSDRNPTLPYAVFLHGRGGNSEQIVALNAIKEMEKMQAEDEPNGFLIFAPSGGDHYWMNAAKSKEKWGDMVTKDLLAFVEDHFAVTSGQACRRALFGISMGGHGVLQLGLNNPELFCNGLVESPVFRRAQDVWRPDNPVDEPHSDFDAFGEGDEFAARSPRELCARLQSEHASSPSSACAGPGRNKQSGSAKEQGRKCLPFARFYLNSGERDVMLDRYPDTRAFIEKLRGMHPEFKIGLETCRSQLSTDSNTDVDGHTDTYWRCQMGNDLRWLASAFRSCEKASQFSAAGTKD